MKDVLSMGKKLVYLTGDETVRVMESDDAEQYQQSLFQSALDDAREEGIVSSDEDSEDYDSDIALKAGQDADGECKIFDLGSIVTEINRHGTEECSDFIEELREAGDEVIGIDGYSDVVDILDNAQCESSLIY